MFAKISLKNQTLTRRSKFENIFDNKTFEIKNRSNSTSFHAEQSWHRKNIAHLKFVKVRNLGHTFDKYTYFSNNIGHDLKTLLVKGFLEEIILGTREASVRFRMRIIKNNKTAVTIKTTATAIFQAGIRECSSCGLKCHAKLLQRNATVTGHFTSKFLGILWSVKCPSLIT